jgi:hypothetical protein
VLERLKFNIDALRRSEHFRPDDMRRNLEPPEPAAPLPANRSPEDAA